MLEIVELNLLPFWPFKNSRPETYYLDFWFGGNTFPYNSINYLKNKKINSTYTPLHCTRYIMTNPRCNRRQSAGGRRSTSKIAFTSQLKINRIKN
jgi:hypothetical protein